MSDAGGKWLARRRQDPAPSKVSDVNTVNNIASQQKLEYFMRLADEAINGGRHLLILVENLLNVSEMNRLIEPTYIVMAVALANSEHSDASHLLTYLGPGLYVVTTPLVYRPMEGYEFAELLNIIKSGKYVDERTKKILVMYRISEPREYVDYAVFAVGNSEYIDTAVNLIEQTFGRARAVFKASFDDISEVYCVLLLPLAQSELQEWILQLSTTSQQEVKKHEPS